MRALSIGDFEALPVADRLYYASSLSIEGTVLSCAGIAQVVSRYWGGTPGLAYSTPALADSAQTVVNDWFSWAKIATDGISGQLDGEKFFAAEFLDLANNPSLSTLFDNATTNVHGVLSRSVDREDDTGSVQSVGASGTTAVDGHAYPTRAVAVLTGASSDPDNTVYAYVRYVQASGGTVGAWVASELSP